MAAPARVSAIVLAAGLSRRAAPHNKLLLPSGQSTVVRATVEAMCGVGFDEVIVATGHQRERIEDVLQGLSVRFAFASDYAQGMGHSLATAVRAAKTDAIAFAVTPGDLPALSASVVTRIVGCFTAESGRCHVIPTADGARGHPVILGAWLRASLENLSGDEGARRLLARPDEAARCRFFEVGDPAILRDVDEATGSAQRGS